MASANATDLNTKNSHMGEFGNAWVKWGAVTPTAGAVNDVFRPVRIPAGIEVTDININWADLDSGSALSVKIGYEPVNAVDGPVANDAYFQATNTFMSGTAGIRQLVFRPIKFEFPVYITIIPTIAATGFQSGEIVAKVYGENVGIK